MTIRRTATWMKSVDDRILEALDGDSWSTPRYLSSLRGIHATEAQVRERCEVLAEVELVAFLTADDDFVGLTTTGRQYLEGKVDVELYPKPRHPSLAERGVRSFRVK